MTPAFSYQQRNVIVQRLTALWAFSESGLGGMLHAFKMPFTGLIVGGIAIVLITLIGKFSVNKNQLLKSLAVVLLVKAIVSPHTPVAAYAAVSFQALIAYFFFTAFKINMLTIMLVSVLAMIESAIQKLLLLTFFFGHSFWKATDELVAFIARQFGVMPVDGSAWLIGLYLGIYITGGILTGIFINYFLRNMSVRKQYIAFNSSELALPAKRITHKNVQTAKLLLTLSIISILLFLFASDSQTAISSTIKAIAWTTTAIVVWYVIINPVLMKILNWILGKSRSKYAKDLDDTLSFLPEINQLTVAAWKATAGLPPSKKVLAFTTILITWSLPFSDNEQSLDT